jgi:hypothetical protein
MKRANVRPDLTKIVLAGLMVLAAGAAIFLYVTNKTGDLQQQLDAHATTLSEISQSLDTAEHEIPERLKDSNARLQKLHEFRDAVARLKLNLDAKTFDKVANAHSLAELVVSTSVQLLQSSKLAFQAYGSALELLTENQRRLAALLIGDGSGAADAGKIADALQRIETLLETGDGVNTVLGEQVMKLEISWLELSREADRLRTTADEESKQLAGTIDRYLGIGGTSLEQARKTQASGEGLSKALRQALATQKSMASAVK